MNTTTQEILDYFQCTNANKWVEADTLLLALKIWSVFEKYTRFNMPEPNLSFGSQKQAGFNWRKYNLGDNKEFLEIEIFPDGNCEFYYNGTRGVLFLQKNLKSIEKPTATTFIPKKIRDKISLFYMDK